MKILVISNNYPSNQYPTHGIFVYNLIQKFVELGHEVTVISSRNILKSPKQKGNETRYGSEKATVFYPRVISASNKWFFGFNTHLIGEKFAVMAIKKVVKKNELQFDVIYSHFLNNGFTAIQALSSFGKPIFVAEGELRNINIRKTYYKSQVYQRIISNISGFIAVSPQIRDNLIEVGANPDKIIIKPNAVDINHFYPRDKKKMREKFGLPLNKKLVIFVGRFVEDKGPVRVLRAVDNIDDIGVVFVGKGNQVLNGDKIVFNGKVTTALVPELLSAADLFVLPTLHEGSCNAIIEAMACGLPIVSSDIPEIRFQCDSKSSILVEPMGVNEIEHAIQQIVTDEDKCITMGQEALKYSQQFEITNRAKSILDFMEERV